VPYGITLNHIAYLDLNIFKTTAVWHLGVETLYRDSSWLVLCVDLRFDLYLLSYSPCIFFIQFVRRLCSNRLAQKINKRVNKPPQRNGDLLVLCMHCVHVIVY